MIRKIVLWITAITVYSAATCADDEVLQVWNCTINDGHTVKELIEVHKKWVEWASGQPGGEDVEGSILTSMVSQDINSVLIVDS